ncbi:MAG TPA: enoyl-CoA hydratase-related protein [Streptosporangiaceae bacterium]|nr:enoyl-CoA hydratase-related protein [Streptosporangiaceae bacterium]
MAEHEVLSEADAGVAIIRLNRPDHRNAFSGTMRAELNTALETFETDDSIRAIVLTGQGRYFSVGADLSRRGEDTFRDSSPNGPGPEREPEPCLTHPWRLRTPLIAAMNGSAAGMGLTIPMAWDIRIAAADAKYSFVFPRRGIVPEFGATWLVPRLAGLSAGLEVLLTGRPFSGTEAAAMGLVSRALPADQVLSAALEIAHDIAAHTSAMSAAATKALVYRGLEEPDRARHHDLESDVFRWTGQQADAREGIAAFLQKRAPHWPLAKTTDFPPQLAAPDPATLR